ncbi:V-type ATP synthase subunit A [candidate division TA06 bacterium]|uniref:V-type ATP synthase alpha chain n=1 Tax=candidate division TA06 bacterium TaxID=2250710 RepID=A0A523XJL9_UNCT6|nr:MAG: V-type ATP synthase subunit A [candidate division TA06 bacterium]
MQEGKIIKVSGPLVVAEGMSGARMHDVARVSEKKLVGEIIELKGDLASIQVYEETGGIGPGEPVYSTGKPLSVELGPGLMESIYDGVQRPLDIIRDMVGENITRGLDVPGLDRKKKWHFEPVATKGQKVQAGDFLGKVKETILVDHFVMVPPNVEGEVVAIKEGDFTVEETVAILKKDGKKKELSMLQRWPVRIPRPYKEKMAPQEMLSTGQRVIDMFFPIGKGGTACCPGPFGSGKTVIQHQLAKWVDADIILFVGCGERGNEMTDVLLEFPELKDPRTGEPLMKRTVLIANTSNMPVAAREASVYTGMTIAEYYRDMGYSVALMADSTSRWAEAMREISGRLEEMPGEEGYPAYLSARIAAFYERAGTVICLGSGERKGALSAIGAVSPPGGDLSDPVVQATLRVVKVFWSLEDKLAYRRHFPAISWLNSYSLYTESLKDYMKKELAEDLPDLQAEAMKLLEQESELEEIVRLVGIDALSADDRLVLEVARSIREDFLHQNAFHEIDTYTSMEKQRAILHTILRYHQKAKEAVKKGISVEDISSIPAMERVARAKYLSEDNVEDITKLEEEIDKQIDGLITKSVA